MGECLYRLRQQLTFISVVIAVTACSDSKQNQDTGQTDQNATVSQAVQAPEQAPQLVSKPVAVGGFKVVESFNVGENVYVRSMAIDSKKSALWVGTSLGVLEVDLKSRNMLGTYTRTHGLANEYVFGMMVDSQGKKWFGTNGGGITTKKDQIWKTYFPMHGLADYWVYSFAEQKNGDIWVGTWAGLSQFNPKSGKFHTYLTELVNEWVYGLDVDSKDRVWIGTEGGINRFDGKTWAVWTHKDGLGAANKDNLPLSDNTGLGTRARHDLNVTAQGMPTYNPNYVFSLAVAKNDVVWAGTWGGGVSRFDGKQWQNFTKEQGVAGNIIYSVAEGNGGDMWFGTNEGLSRYDGKNWYNFTRKEGLLDNNIYAIAVTGNNEVWVGSKSGVMLLVQQ
ncbi:MAG: regulator [Gammaproteobacteria bacterium]|nr:regulator [Gammaproteobacteria bacterium]MDH5800841.1 regulator [Gammaproteobacteria bacterium]